MSELPPEFLPGGAKYWTKDSGEKAAYSDGMQRDTSEGKPAFHLMVPLGTPYEEQLLTRVAGLYARGAEKYSQSELVTPQELVSWCICGRQTVILTGLTTLSVCAETVMKEICESATLRLQQISEEIQKSGSSEISPEKRCQIWLMLSEVAKDLLSEKGTEGGGVWVWARKTANAYWLAQTASALSALITSEHLRTWITTIIPAWREDFFVHAVTKAWDSSEIQKIVFGVHLPTCSIHQLRSTSEGLSSGLGRNWERSCTPESLDHHLGALWRHFMKFVCDVQDGEDHAAALVWNVNAVLLTRRNIQQAQGRDFPIAPKKTLKKARKKVKKAYAGGKGVPTEGQLGVCGVDKCTWQ